MVPPEEEQLDQALFVGDEAAAHGAEVGRLELTVDEPAPECLHNLCNLFMQSLRFPKLLRSRNILKIHRSIVVFSHNPFNFLERYFEKLFSGVDFVNPKL